MNYLFQVIEGSIANLSQLLKKNLQQNCIF